MLGLRELLLLKIGVTVLFWIVPLLLFPAGLLRALGMPDPRPWPFMRLLGAAFLALVVGYALGLRDLSRGADVRNVVWMGLVSNGSAAVILWICGATGVWRDWGQPARALMWLSAAVLTYITAGLALRFPH